MPEIPLSIYGSDINTDALRLARLNLKEADLEDKIYFQKLPVREVRSRFRYGHIITNPPYGQRLGSLEQAEEVYKELGEVYTSLEDWSLHMLTAVPRPERFLNKRWDKSRKLYNGRLECHYYQFFGPRPPKKELL